MEGGNERRKTGRERVKGYRVAITRNQKSQESTHVDFLKQFVVQNCHLSGNLIG